jgi:hypothetical protein
MDTLKIIIVTTMLVMFTVVIAVLIAVKIHDKTEKEKGEARDLEATRLEQNRKLDNILTKKIQEAPLDDEDKEIIKSYYNSETVKNNNNET